MKLPFYGVLLVLVSCHSQPSAPAHPSTTSTDSTSLTKIEKATALARQLYVIDSVALDDFNGEIRDKYSAQRFNEIIDHFPILYDATPVHPDISYSQSDLYRTFMDSTGKQRELSFGGEAGQDDYYMLYAYFLRKRNGEAALAGKRDTLIRIYRLINNIFGGLEHGGSYFGHQFYRILGYAEYDLYGYLHNKADGFSGKAYNITRDKQLNFQLLRQGIIDEIKKDEVMTAADKVKLQKSLLEKVTTIEKLVTDWFYLESARAFQHACYPIPL